MCWSSPRTPDDAELGMGGAILKLLAAGLQVGVLDLTDGEPTPHGSRENPRSGDSRRDPSCWACRGGRNLGLPNRSLEPTARGPVAARRRHPPHPAAAAVRPLLGRRPSGPPAATQLVEAARFWAKLTKTDLPAGPHHPEAGLPLLLCPFEACPATGVCTGHQRVLGAETAAVASYHSQFIQGRREQPPTFLDRLRDEAAYWGKAIGVDYGEPFACREPLGLRGMGELI